MVSQVDYLYDIILDIKGLNVKRVTTINDEDISFVTWEVNPAIGDSLHIFLNNPLMKQKTIDIVVYYETNEKQTATVWMPKENSIGGNFPLMYT